MRHVKLTSEHDHQSTLMPVCPWCGAEHEAQSQKPGTCQCAACGENFIVSPHVTVRYWTSKADAVESHAQN